MMEYGQFGHEEPLRGRRDKRDRSHHEMFLPATPLYCHLSNYLISLRPQAYSTAFSDICGIILKYNETIAYQWHNYGDATKKGEVARN